MFPSKEARYRTTDDTGSVGQRRDSAAERQVRHLGVATQEHNPQRERVAARALGHVGAVGSVHETTSSLRVGESKERRKDLKCDTP